MLTLAPAFLRVLSHYSARGAWYTVASRLCVSGEPWVMVRGPRYLMGL